MKDPTNRTLVVTKMKNEGPFVLEWLAYHIAIGVDDFLVYTNDCSDGTDRLLDLLAEKGYIEHRQNPFREMERSVHQAVYLASRHEPVFKKADWIVTIDIDEFINIHTGDGMLTDLYAAVPDANLISMTWRLFGNADINEFTDGLVIEQFTRCAPERNPRPLKAWCFKTLFRNNGIFGRLDTHRPKKPDMTRLNEIFWVNGSGRKLQLNKNLIENQRRSNVGTYGYELVTLNHYAVRSAESFVAKSDRGDAMPNSEIGVQYWFSMNNNYATDDSILRQLRRTREILDRMKSDPGIRDAHSECVELHKKTIASLRLKRSYSDLYRRITSDRFEKLSRLHHHFAQSVYWNDAYKLIPDEFTEMELPAHHVFTTQKNENHPVELCEMFQLDPFYSPAEWEG